MIGTHQRAAVRSLKTPAPVLCEPRRRGETSAVGDAAFGLHLTIDGLGADVEKLNDLRTVFRFLAELPSLIGMHAISTPYVVDYNGGEKPEDAGISGFVLIAESHISVHTFPLKGFVTIDVFSCRPFDTRRVVDVATETFGIERAEVHTLKRGHGFPRT